MKKGDPKHQFKKATKVKQLKRKQVFFPSTSHQTAIRTNLRLLSVNDQQYQKQTKSSLTNNDLFLKSISQTTKQFFFICQLSMKYLASPQQHQQLMMWYPPRTVNEQIQFKKQFCKLLQKLQSQNSLPKNIILGKRVVMEETNTSSLLQFLRILTELALRSLYIQKYSKDERIIQISLQNASTTPGQSQNNINRFYIFPFCQTSTATEPPIKSPQQLEAIAKLYKVYIERYRKKILALRTVETEQNVINPQKLMSQILEQKQLWQALTTKVNKSIYSENRAFDRRVILQKNAQIWKQLQALQCNYIDGGQDSILKIEGQTGKLIANWKTVTGTHTLLQFVSHQQQIKSLKAKCDEKINQLKILRKYNEKKFKEG